MYFSETDFFPDLHGELVRISVVVGTRPEAIKLAPVILAARAAQIETSVCVTAQHRELLDEVLTLFSIVPEYDLDVMSPSQELSSVTSAVVLGLDEILGADRPDWLVVQGDTTTTMAAALAAFHRGVPVAHVEAGLRSGTIERPFPEEANRRIATVLASLHLAPTEEAAHNLEKEGVSPDRLAITGNTVVDAASLISQAPYDWATGSLAHLDLPDKKIALVTAHRRESHGEPLLRICAALKLIAEQFPEYRIVFPVHPNPSVREVVLTQLGSVPGIALLPPLDYLSLINLMKRATIVLTDSGGIQEEAPSFGAKVIVLRQETERPELIRSGWGRLAGTDPAAIFAEFSELAASEGPKFSGTINLTDNPFGDGKAADRIIDELIRCG